MILLCHWFLFWFHKKSATELFVRYVKNVIAIRTCVNWFKRFENGDCDVSDKKRSGCFATMEKDKLRKDGKE